MKPLSSRAALAALLLLPAAQALSAELAAPGAPAIPPSERGSTLPGAAPAETPAAPQIDAAARALLQQISNAYKSTNAFSAKIEGEIVGARPEPIKATVEVSFARPDRAFVRRTDEDGTASISAQNSRLFIVDSAVKDQYLRRGAWTAHEAMMSALRTSSLAGPGLDEWISGGDILAQMGDAVKSAKLGQPETVDGVAVESVVLEVSTQRGDATMTISAGKNDHLLRRVTLERSLELPDGSNRKVMISETHRDVRVGSAVDLKRLNFVPPAGAKAVAAMGPQTYHPGLKVGATPLSITTKDTAGKPISLDQYKGKVVLLDFWASWCGPCIAEMPGLVKAYQKYKPQGFDVIGISLDRDKGALTEFARQFDMPWRQIFEGKDYEGPTPMRYQVQAIPLQILIGRDGKVAAVQAFGADLEQAIKTELAKKPASAKPAAKPAVKPVAKATAKKKK